MPHSQNSNYGRVYASIICKIRMIMILAACQRPAPVLDEDTGVYVAECGNGILDEGEACGKSACTVRPIDVGRLRERPRPGPLRADGRRP